MKAGICDPKNGALLGQANVNLKWQQGGPYLNYTNGDFCGNATRHYTIIAFFCGPEGSPSLPILMEENPCQAVIHWNTDVVCEKRASTSHCTFRYLLYIILFYFIKCNKIRTLC